jgi:hypothetical protein
MNIKDHGVWQRYVPVKLPENAPPNALFARRTGDGVDWYVYVNAGKSFSAGTVKMTLIDNVVAAATTDPTALFPGGAAVLEVSGAPAGNPQENFGGKVYDPATKSFSDPPEPEIPATTIEDLLKRLEALEKRRE